MRRSTNDSDAVAALSDFARFPRWMWRNEAVVEFIGWLHEHNRQRPLTAHTFDLMIHIDDTHAVRPLERWSREETDVPETYPTGI